MSLALCRSVCKEKPYASSPQHGGRAFQNREATNLRRPHVATSWWRTLLPESAAPLQDFITQYWSTLLTRQRLQVHLQLAEHAPLLDAEIFIGDEFTHSGTQHVDVVIRLAQKSGNGPLPTVLEYEKHAVRLVRQEVNGLPLEALVLS